MPIDWNAPLRTLCGDAAEFIRELQTDDEFPMLVIVTGPDGLQEAECYRADGTYARDREPCPWDLVNATNGAVAEDAAEGARAKEGLPCLTGSGFSRKR